MSCIDWLLCSNAPKSDVWPDSRSRAWLDALAKARSITENCPAREPARPSHAPLLMSASSTLRFTVRVSQRSHKSNKSPNGSPVSRALMIASTAMPPTPLIAAMPKRMTEPSRAGANSTWLSLTSGGNTSMSSDRASSVNTPNLAVSPMSLVMLAARNSTGKCAFR